MTKHDTLHSPRLTEDMFDSFLIRRYLHGLPLRSEAFLPIEGRSKAPWANFQRLKGPIWVSFVSQQGGVCVYVLCVLFFNYITCKARQASGRIAPFCDHWKLDVGPHLHSS